MLMQSMFSLCCSRNGRPVGHIQFAILGMRTFCSRHVITVGGIACCKSFDLAGHTRVFALVSLVITFQNWMQI